MARYNAIFLLICSLDLLFTVYVLEFFHGAELNPILNYYYLQGGIYGLIFAKIFFTIKTFFLISQVNRRFPSRPRKQYVIAYRAVICLYIIALMAANLFINFSSFF